MRYLALMVSSCKELTALVSQVLGFYASRVILTAFTRIVPVVWRHVSFNEETNWARDVVVHCGCIQFEGFRLRVSFDACATISC